MTKIEEEVIDFFKDKYESPKPDIVIIDEKTEKKKNARLDKENNSK